MRKPSTTLACAFLSIFAVAAAHAADEAIQGDWRVEQIDGAPVLKGSTVTMRFDAEGRVSGKASCNRYGASYRIDGESVSFTQAMATRMACPPPLMQQEQRFLGLFGAQASWSTDDGALTISGGNGVVVRARRAAGR